ncbi:ECF-type sigma factor [Terriglobus sp.]|uniref:ECF-type sigma factor n=1 Tax=Terriglobus sp. TaxID=1889013 RepID=UPI003B00B2C6
MPPPLSRKELDDLFSLIYEELRRLARNVLRRDRDANVSPTTLVHEAWVKLSKAPALASLSRIHFQNLAARAMRQILVDAVRHRAAAMHGGGITHVTFDTALGPGTVVDDREFQALHAALDRLEQLHLRQAKVVEARYFGGLTFAECSELLDISVETAQRDWRMARAWLELEIRRELHLTAKPGDAGEADNSQGGVRGLGHAA